MTYDNPLYQNPLNVGDLVFDCDPWKAPEARRGLGIVVEILNSDYVVVHWSIYHTYAAVNIGYVELVNY